VSELVPLASGIELTATSLGLPEHMPFDDWQQTGRTLARAAEGVMWWLGDWWRYGQHAYGDRVRSFEVTGFAFGTCMNAGRVSGAFETSRRREVLMWGHHVEVASLEPAYADKLLDAAEAEGWSVHARQLNASRADFINVVWPAIKWYVRGKELIPVESVTSDDMARKLDMLAGIDSWIIRTPDDIIGLASRVQWCFSYNTFTVRYAIPSGGPTEFHKRKAALASPGALCPYLTCQAYISDHGGSLLSAAIVMTADLIGAVELGIGEERDNGDGTGTRMWVVPWREMCELTSGLGHPMVIVRPNQQDGLR
jgi:hypothetical protein